jgi:hypothetical protein
MPPSFPHDYIRDNIGLIRAERSDFRNPSLSCSEYCSVL